MAAPPFTVTPRVLALLAEVERLVGRGEGFDKPRPQPRLRKEGRVRTVRGSVAIEGNTLTLEQVTAVLEGRRVVGPRADIVAVQNAIAAYEAAPRLRAWRETDLLKAHRLLMQGLVRDAGRYRAGAVGVLHGDRVVHAAPPARRVPSLVFDLLSWAQRSEGPLLLTACVVHYELLFIHPFTDGNGRLARLWQHVALLGVSPLFAYVPVESVIRERQAAYYGALRASDRAGDATRFVEFSLEALRDTLAEMVDALRPERPSATTRLAAAAGAFGKRWFSRRDYLHLHRTLSTATASRDLLAGVEANQLRRKGERRLTRYQFVRYD